MYTFVHGPIFIHRDTMPVLRIVFEPSTILLARALMLPHTVPIFLALLELA